MAWKVQENKTNAVEESRLTSTVVGAGGCVIYPPPYYCIRWQDGAWLTILCQQQAAAMAGKIVAQLAPHISWPPRFQG